MINNLEQDTSNNEMTLTIAKQRMNNNPPPQASVNYNVYKSHDSGISSNGFYASPSGLTAGGTGSKLQRGEGDGSEEYHHNNTLPKLYEKYPLEPPELPPRDYTTDEDNLEGKI